MRSSMLGHGRVLLGAVVLLALGAGEAAALDFDLDGWWRVRHRFIANAPVDASGQDENNIEFLEHRAALFPVLNITEDIQLKGRLDLLDQVIFGQNEDEPSILAGLSDATSQFDRELDPVDDIQLEHLYAQIRTKVGLIRIGRMPSNWGLGILANGGGTLEWGTEGNGSEAGDTADRLLFLTDLARAFGWDEQHHWVSALVYDRTTELEIVNEGDDVHFMIWANLYTNGDLSPRRLGTREIGSYTVFVTDDDDDADVVIIDGYFHLEQPIGDVSLLFLEGEGAIAIGQTNRGGLVPTTRRQAFVDTITEGLAGTLPQSLAESIAQNGTDIGLVQTLVAEGLVEEGLSQEVADTIAAQGASAGFDVAREQVLDVQAFGAVVRGGYDQGFVRFTVEGAYASGGKEGDRALINFVGPVGSSGPEAHAALEGLVDDALGAAVRGKEIATYPFDSEFDAALILYEELGPVNPVNLRPLVTNTTYLKGTVELDFGDTRFYLLGLWGQLNEGVETFRIEGADDGREDTPVTIVSEGVEKDLGIEIDAGLDRSFGEHLRAEVKLGYLLVGDAFGPRADDVFMVRSQVGLTF